MSHDELLSKRKMSRTTRSSVAFRLWCLVTFLATFLGPSLRAEDGREAVQTEIAKNYARLNKLETGKFGYRATEMGSSGIVASGNWGQS